MVGERENLIACRMVFVHDIGGSKPITCIIGLSCMGVEIALKLIDRSPINIGVRIVGYNRSDGLSVHDLEIYCAVCLSGSAIEFDV